MCQRKISSQLHFSKFKWENFAGKFPSILQDRRKFFILWHSVRQPPFFLCFSCFFFYILAPSLSVQRSGTATPHPTWVRNEKRDFHLPQLIVQAFYTVVFCREQIFILNGISTFDRNSSTLHAKFSISDLADLTSLLCPPASALRHNRWHDPVFRHSSHTTGIMFRCGWPSCGLYCLWDFWFLIGIPRDF